MTQGIKLKVKRIVAPNGTIFEVVRRIQRKIDREREEIARQRRKMTPTPPLDDIDIYVSTLNYRTPLLKNGLS